MFRSGLPGSTTCRFYRAIALWRDEMSDEKHEVVGRLSSALIEQNPKVFEPLLFSLNFVKEHHKKSKITGTWAETVDIFSCASRPVWTFSTSQKKWFTSKPIMITDSCSSITTKKQCNFFKQVLVSSKQQTDLVNFLYFLRVHRLRQEI